MATSYSLGAILAIAIALGVTALLAIVALAVVAVVALRQRAVINAGQTPRPFHTEPLGIFRRRSTTPAVAARVLPVGAVGEDKANAENKISKKVSLQGKKVQELGTSGAGKPTIKPVGTVFNTTTKEQKKPRPAALASPLVTAPPATGALNVKKSVEAASIVKPGGSPEADVAAGTAAQSASGPLKPSGRGTQPAFQDSAQPAQPGLGSPAQLVTKPQRQLLRPSSGRSSNSEDESRKLLAEESRKAQNHQPLPRLLSAGHEERTFKTGPINHNELELGDGIRSNEGSFKAASQSPISAAQTPPLDVRKELCHTNESIEKSFTQAVTSRGSAIPPAVVKQPFDKVTGLAVLEEADREEPYSQDDKPGYLDPTTPTMAQGAFDKAFTGEHSTPAPDIRQRGAISKIPVDSHLSPSLPPPVIPLRTHNRATSEPMPGVEHSPPTSLAQKSNPQSKHVHSESVPEIITDTSMLPAPVQGKNLNDLVTAWQLKASSSSRSSSLRHYSPKAIPERQVSPSPASSLNQHHGATTPNTRARLLRSPSLRLPRILLRNSLIQAETKATKNNLKISEPILISASPNAKLKSHHKSKSSRPKLEKPLPLPPSIPETSSRAQAHTGTPSQHPHLELRDFSPFMIRIPGSFLSTDNKTSSKSSRVSEASKTGADYGALYGMPSNPGIVADLKGRLHKADWIYSPRIEDEIELRHGDLLRVYQVFDDGWCFAKKQSEPYDQGICPLSALVEVP